MKAVLLALGVLVTLLAGAWLALASEQPQFAEADPLSDAEAAPLSEAARRVIADDGERPRVLFFYYGWHSGGADGRHWSDGITDMPQAGYYDNHDLNDTLHQFRTIRDAGGHGIILSWWGADSFEEESLRVAVEAGEQTGVHVTASFEAWNDPFRWSGSDKKVEQLEHIWNEHAQSPAWLRTDDGTPVVFVHAAGLRDAEHWQTVFDKLAAKGIRFHAYAEVRDPDQARSHGPVFDGLYYYMPIELLEDGVLPNANREMREIGNVTGAEWLSTVPPAYDNSNDSIRRFHIVVDYRDGDLMREAWASAMEDPGEFVLLATWNEWNEGTTYEPGVADDGRRLALAKQLMQEAGLERASAPPSALPAAAEGLEPLPLGT